MSEASEWLGLVTTWLRFINVIPPGIVLALLVLLLIYCAHHRDDC